MAKRYDPPPPYEEPERAPLLGGDGYTSFPQPHPSPRTPLYRQYGRQLRSCLVVFVITLIFAYLGSYLFVKMMGRDKVVVEPEPVVPVRVAVVGKGFSLSCVCGEGSGPGNVKWERPER
jgi:hypothetical protein